MDAVMHQSKIGDTRRRTREEEERQEALTSLQVLRTSVYAGSKLTAALSGS